MQITRDIRPQDYIPHNQRKTMSETSTQQQPAVPEREKANQEDMQAAKAFLTRMTSLDLSEVPPAFFKALASLVPLEHYAERIGFDEAKKIYKDRLPREFPAIEFDALDFDESDTSPAANLIRTIKDTAERQFADQPEKALRYEKVLLRTKLREVLSDRGTAGEFATASKAALSPSDIELIELRNKAKMWDDLVAEIESARLNGGVAATPAGATGAQQQP